MKYLKWFLLIIFLLFICYGVFIYFSSTRVNPNYPSQCPTGIFAVKDIIQPYLKYELSFSNQELPAIMHLGVSAIGISENECRYGVSESNSIEGYKARHDFILKKISKKDWTVVSHEVIVTSEAKSNTGDLRF